jgi:peptide-methionine (S)-S-oxide reductase
MYKKSEMVSREQSLAGHSDPMQLEPTHFLTAESMFPPFPSDRHWCYFAMGCFWGAERQFWLQSGVSVTAVGYIGGYTKNPSYEEACSGLTGHTEAVLVVYEPAIIGFAQLLKVFWESHDPTQGMRQGNDIGSQYRSGIYCTSDYQLAAALKSKSSVQQQLDRLGYASITSEIVLAPDFYYAEGYHQQYLAKNPRGYCGLRGTGIQCA